SLVPPGTTVLLASRTLYAVHDFPTYFSSIVFRWASRRFDQLLHSRGPRRQDRHDLFSTTRRYLIPMRFGNLLDQTMGTQQRQQPRVLLTQRVRLTIAPTLLDRPTTQRLAQFPKRRRRL